MSELNAGPCGRLRRRHCLVLMSGEHRLESALAERIVSAEQETTI